MINASFLQTFFFIFALFCQSSSLNALPAKDSLILTGPWLFYWQKLIEHPSQLSQPDAVLPEALPWTQLVDHSFPSQGFGTYVTRINLHSWPSDLAALILPNSYGTMKIIILDEDSQKVLFRQYSDGFDQNSPHFPFSSILGSFPVQKGQNLLMFIQYKNFWHAKAGMRKVPILYSSDSGLEPFYRVGTVQILSIGFCLILICYNLIQWQKMPEDRESFYLFLAALISSTRLIGTSTFIAQALPVQFGHLLLSLQYAPIASVSICFILMLESRFAIKLFKEPWDRNFKTFGFVISSIPLWTPIFVFTSLLWLFQIVFLLTCIWGAVLLGLAVSRKLEGVRQFILSVCLLFFSGIYDVVFVDRLRLSDIEATPLGLSFFFIAQTYSIVLKHQKIRQKNLELAESQQEMQEALLIESEERLRLAADLAHNVNNPLNYIEINKEALSLSVQSLHELLGALLGSEPSDDPDIQRLQITQKTMQLETQAAFESLELGIQKTSKAVREMRILSGLDGKALDRIPLQNFISACKTSMLTMMSTEQINRLEVKQSLSSDAAIYCNESILRHVLCLFLTAILQSSEGTISLYERQVESGCYKLLAGGKFLLKEDAQKKLRNRLKYLLNATDLIAQFQGKNDEWILELNEKNRSASLSATLGRQ